MTFSLEFFATEEDKQFALKVREAFQGVTLGDGIGFHEADCIDDYLEPTHPIYIKWKAQDEREDWFKVHLLLREWYEDYNYSSQQCFMDAKGVYFFLPSMLLFGYSGSFECMVGRMVDSILEQRTGEVNKGNFGYSKHSIDLEKMLTSQQKNVIFECIEQEVKTNKTWGGIYKKDGTDTYQCTKCGGVHFVEIPMSTEEMMEEMKDRDVYKIWMFFKEHWFGDATNSFLLGN
jgi:hypothetical protein